MIVRWLVLLALAAPLGAAEPRRDPDGVPLPDGCLARVGSTKFRIWHGLVGPTFTADGELLFTERDGNAVHFRFMDARTGLFVRKSTVMRAEVSDPNGRWRNHRVSHDGRTLLCETADANGGSVHAVTWDIAARAVVGRVPVAPLGTIANGLSDNFRWLARWDGDTGDVTLTDTRTGRIRRIVRVNTAERPALFPAPDGGSVLVVADTVGLFDARTGRLIREFDTGAEPLSPSEVVARYSADGKTLAVHVIALKRPGVFACDVATGTVTPLDVKADRVVLLGVSPDGSKIAFGDRVESDFLVRVRDGQRVPVGVPLRDRLSFDPTGKRFAVVSAGTVLVHDADTGELVSAPADPTVRGLQFSEDGQTLTTYGDLSVSRWNAGGGWLSSRYDRPAKWEGLPFAVGRLAFAHTPDGLKLTDARTGERVAGFWNYLAEAPKWRASDDGRVVVAAVLGVTQMRLKPHRVGADDPGDSLWVPLRYAEGLSVSADGGRVAVVGPASPAAFFPVRGRPRPPPPAFSRVLTCDLATGDIHTLDSVRNPYSSPVVKLTPDGARLLVACERWPAGVRLADGQDLPDPSVILDARTGDRVAELDLGDGRPEVAASADSRAFAVGSPDGTVRVIEAATGGLRATFHHRTAVVALAFSLDGTTLVAASDDAPVYLWDVRGRTLGLPPTFDADAGEALWAALADKDAGRAFDAMRRLTAAPDDATKLLARKLPPAAPPAPAWVDERLADLSSRAFADRERATNELAAVAELIRPRLTAEQAWNESPEVQRRLATVFAGVRVMPPDWHRARRAVEVMEWIRTPAARRLVKAWAGGSERAPLTVAAGHAEKRLAR